MVGEIRHPPEILRYLGFVADRTICAATSASDPCPRRLLDDAKERWLLTTDKGPAVSCRHYIMATGCLSQPKPPEIDGVHDFKGEIYFTSRWPHDGVDLRGKAWP